MKFKRTLIKVLAATAITATGVSVAQPAFADTTDVNADINSATDTTDTTANDTTNTADSTKKVVVNYVSGYGINIWNNYKNKKWTGKRVNHGTTVTVLDQTTYKGNTWYKIGDNQWIMAKYTLSTDAWAKKAAKAKAEAKAAAEKKAAQEKASKSVDAKRNKVVALAKTELGKPYVWGATGPYSFDCSGLTSYVYQHALGRNITRTTYTQVHQGKTVAVSTATLKKGDLIFWGSASAPYHVGIYAGNGKYIHAATPGQGVIQARLSYYFWPSTAKRII